MQCSSVHDYFTVFFSFLYMQVVKRVNGFHLKPYHPATDAITEDDNLPSEKCMDDYPPTDKCLDDKPSPPDNISEISDDDSISDK